MKKDRDIVTSPYREFLDFLKNKKEVFHLKDTDYYLNQYSFFKNIVDLVPCSIYMLNFQLGRYLYFNGNIKNLTGFSAEEIMASDLKWVLARVHPDDAAVYNTAIFNRFLDYAHSSPIVEVKKTRFSYNWRFRRKDESYVKILQQYVILEQDKLRNPILTLGILTDITTHKSDDKMVFSISKYDENKGYEINIFSDAFATTTLSITKRESEIIKLLVQGHGSKEIAERLNVSLFTIKAHRRNLLEKTNCKNVAELSSYAHTSGLI